MVISREHHICDTLWCFPSKEELQSSLENYAAISDPLLQDKKITGIFANGLANRIRSPFALRKNIRLLLAIHESEIAPERREAIYKLFNEVLPNIAIPYSNR